MYAIDPDLVLLKWAYKTGDLSEDDLCELHARRRRESPDGTAVELAVRWGMLTQDQIDALLTPESIEAGLAAGQIDQKNADALRQLLP